jgi:hypothetical protein
VAPTPSAIARPGSESRYRLAVVGLYVVVVTAFAVVLLLPRYGYPIEVYEAVVYATAVVVAVALWIFHRIQTTRSPRPSSGGLGLSPLAADTYCPGGSNQVPQATRATMIASCPFPEQLGSGVSGAWRQDGVAYRRT